MGHGAVRRRAPSYVVLRLCNNIAAGWQEWDGALALQGVDIHRWTLTRMLNAAEAAMDAAAADDAERARNRARLYAPPRGTTRRRAAVGGTRPPTVSRADAEALLAQVAAEDSRLAGR